MATEIPWHDVERLVGAKRGPLHKAMLVPPGDPRGDEEWVINVLHSTACFRALGTGPGGNPDGGKREGLLDCPYTDALDNLLRDDMPLDLSQWEGYVSVPVAVRIALLDEARGPVLVPVARCVR